MSAEQLEEGQARTELDEATSREVRRTAATWGAIGTGAASAAVWAGKKFLEIQAKKKLEQVAGDTIKNLLAGGTGRHGI